MTFILRKQPCLLDFCNTNTLTTSQQRSQRRKEVSLLGKLTFAAADGQTSLLEEEVLPDKSNTNLLTTPPSIRANERVRVESTRWQPAIAVVPARSHREIEGV